MKNRTRRLFGLALALSMSLGLVGCGGQPAAAGQEPDPGATQPVISDSGEEGRIMKKESDREKIADVKRDFRTDKSGQGAGIWEKDPDSDASPGLEPGSGAGPGLEPGSGAGDTGTSANVPGTLPFTDSFAFYLETEGGFSGQSYVSSPASLQAALCLAIEGAEGDTQAGLLRAAGFASLDEARAWYRSLILARDAFLEDYAAERMIAAEYGGGEDPGMAFDIANAIWSNSDLAPGFKPSYIQSAADNYGARAAVSDASSITGDVNGWCDEATHGMIPSISDDLSGTAAVLANAIYIKSAWRDEFSENNTEPGTFTCPDGSELNLDFMKQTERFAYYKDDKGREYAVFPLKGDVYFTVCLDTAATAQDMLDAMENSEGHKLHVTMPKLDLESTIGTDALKGYLADAGAGQAFSDNAEFWGMTDDPRGWKISDVLQKARIKTDEQGLEAAAVTAITMDATSAMPEPEEIIDFHMDHAFRFLITYGPENLVLFSGQYTGK